MLTPIDLLKIFFIFFIELKKWNITDNERVALIYYVAFKLSYPGGILYWCEKKGPLLTTEINSG